MKIEEVIGEGEYLREAWFVVAKEREIPHHLSRICFQFNYYWCRRNKYMIMMMCCVLHAAQGAHERRRARAQGRRDAGTQSHCATSSWQQHAITSKVC